jgi:hypothetical protein
MIDECKNGFYGGRVIVSLRAVENQPVKARVLPDSGAYLAD